MRKGLTFTAAILALAIPAGAGVTIYANNGLARPYPFGNPDELVMFDSDNPEDFVVIGSMNVPNIGFGGLDFDRDGNLWAYAAFFKSTGGAASGLYSVDIETGQATAVGAATIPLDDIAYNPADDTMYGIRSQGPQNRLYSIDLDTGAVTLVGLFTGGPAPAQPRSIGLACDSQGTFHVHDQGTDAIYRSNGMELELLYELEQETLASQGMTIDWSNGDQGYHAAVGQGVFPDYFSQINTFATDGSGYVLGPDFGPVEHFPGDQFGYPLVEPGDLAIRPTPCGDIDGSGTVDVSDLGALLGEFGLSGKGLAGDVNRDGTVDVSDLGILLSRFGQDCP